LWLRVWEWYINTCQVPYLKWKAEIGAVYGTPGATALTPAGRLCYGSSDPAACPNKPRIGQFHKIRIFK
jgi:hypothetical protein